MSDPAGVRPTDSLPVINPRPAKLPEGITGRLYLRLASAGNGNGKAKDDKPEAAGAAIEFEEVEAAETPRELGAILGELVSHLCRFMHMPEGAAETVACWVAWTYVAAHSYILPILAIKSPTKGCGKTTLLDVIERFIARPSRSAATTEAALFRFIEAHHPTLLLDEADVWLKGRDEASKAITAVVNDGHRRGGGVLRCVGDDHETRLFRVDCPKAIAGIGDFMADTTADRSIIVTLDKAPPGAALESFRGDRPIAPGLRSDLKRWADDHGETFAAVDPDAAPLRNREADNWRPLFGVADLAGGDWPAIVRRAAGSLKARAESRDEAVSPQERLLRDAFTVFDHHTSMPTADFDEGLLNLPDGPYQEWRRGKPITAQARGRLLSKFGIAVQKSGDLRYYDRGDFEAHWEAHGIPPQTPSVEPPEPPEPPCSSPTPSGSGGSGGSFQGMGDPPPVPVEQPPLVMSADPLPAEFNPRGAFDERVELSTEGDSMTEDERWLAAIPEGQRNAASDLLKRSRAKLDEVRQKCVERGSSLVRVAGRLVEIPGDAESVEAHLKRIGMGGLEWTDPDAPVYLPLPTMTPEQRAVFDAMRQRAQRAS